MTLQVSCQFHKAAQVQLLPLLSRYVALTGMMSLKSSCIQRSVMFSGVVSHSGAGAAGSQPAPPGGGDGAAVTDLSACTAGTGEKHGQTELHNFVIFCQL